MRKIRHIAIGLSAVTTLAAMTLNAETVSVEPPQPKVVTPPKLVLPIVPEVELPPAVTATNAGFSAFPSPFAAHASPASQITASSSVLSGPVTLNYSGTATALQVNDTGTGKAILATINNPKNTSSAFYGQTNGTAAGLSGYNTGTGGPAAKMIINNASSQQSALFASTSGTGSAITATVTNVALGSTFPALLAQNAGSLGIIGDGATVGVQGDSTGGGGYGVAGYSRAKGSSQYGAGIGVYGASGSGDGIEGTNQTCCGAGVSGTSSTNGYGVYGASVTGIGIAAYSGSSTALVVAVGGSFFTADGEAVNVQSVSTPGIIAHSKDSYAIAGSSDTSIGVSGSSTNSYGIYGYDAGTGVGVFGGSAKGLAGSFSGNVNISGTLTVGSTTYTSDRNLKADVRPIDRKDLLERVGSLAISSWDYKSDTTRRHIGPMAQDFHAAFGLNGADETHINEVDIAGVSLAAIQELHRQMRQKDARIDKLEAQLVEQEVKAERTNELAASLAKRLAALETKLTTDARYAVLNQR